MRHLIFGILMMAAMLGSFAVVVGAWFVIITFPELMYILGPAGVIAGFSLVSYMID